MNLHWIIKILLWITWLEHNFCIGESAITLKQRLSAHNRSTKTLSSFLCVHAPDDPFSTLAIRCNFDRSRFNSICSKNAFLWLGKFTRNRRQSRDSHKTFFTQTNQLYDDARVRLNIFFSYSLRYRD